MSTVQLEAEITTEGGLRLLSPLPAWLKPGRAEVALTVPDSPTAAENRKRQKLTASPEMLAARKQALRALRDMGGLSSVILDPLVWQKDIRQDRPLPGRD